MSVPVWRPLFTENEEKTKRSHTKTLYEVSPKYITRARTDAYDTLYWPQKIMASHASTSPRKNKANRSALEFEWKTAKSDWLIPERKVKCISHMNALVASWWEEKKNLAPKSVTLSFKRFLARDFSKIVEWSFDSRWEKFTAHPSEKLSSFFLIKFERTDLMYCS